MVNDYVERTEVTRIVMLQIIKYGLWETAANCPPPNHTAVTNLLFPIHYNIRKCITLTVLVSKFEITLFGEWKWKRQEELALRMDTGD